MAKLSEACKQLLDAETYVKAAQDVIKETQVAVDAALAARKRAQKAYDDATDRYDNARAKLLDAV